MKPNELIAIGVELRESMKATANRQAFIEDIEKKAKKGPVTVTVQVNFSVHGPIYSWEVKS